MIGGTVIETIVLPEKVWINTKEDTSTSTCAIYVENSAKSRSVSEGDSVWWQSDTAYWTPACMRTKQCDHDHHVSCKKAGVDYDIKLRRIGFSGVSRPGA